MLNIEECTEIWKICQEGSMKKLTDNHMELEYGIVCSQDEIEADIVKLEQAGYIARAHGYGLKIRKAEVNV